MFELGAAMDYAVLSTAPPQHFPSMPPLFFSQRFMHFFMSLAEHDLPSFIAIPAQQDLLSFI
jgi:hypothetical protein